jgi:glycosyltransferase involved in cell wall biosynthesis
MSISVLLLAKNEEQNLPRCLRGIDWCNDIVLIDDFSTDRTKEIAESFGVRVIQRKFDTFAAQRNYALDRIQFKHSWILHLDADEVVTSALHSEILKRISDTPLKAYRVPSKTIFLGKWMRFAGTYPAYQVRLGCNPHLRFKQVGHGQREDLEPSLVGPLFLLERLQRVVRQTQPVFTGRG